MGAVLDLVAKFVGGHWMAVMGASLGVMVGLLAWLYRLVRSHRRDRVARAAGSDGGAKPSRRLEALRTLAAANRTANGWLRTFYAAVALIALVGQTQAGQHWLTDSDTVLGLLAALPAVAVLELGGIALLAHADARQQVGERAIAARLLSAAVALTSVLINWFGHLDKFGHQTLAGWFFAIMSALGYAVWLIHSAAKRRDRLREQGKLPDPLPVYPWAERLRHPLVVERARALAARDPQLGMYASLDAARAQLETERRHRQLGELLHRRFHEALKDPTAAEIAAASFDLDRVAAMLAERADYTGLVGALRRDLAPGRLTGSTDTQPTAPTGRPIAGPVDKPAGPPVEPPATEPGGGVGVLDRVPDFVPSEWLSAELAGGTGDRTADGTDGRGPELGRRNFDPEPERNSESPPRRIRRSRRRTETVTNRRDGGAETVMWRHWEKSRQAGETPSGADLDRVAGTNNYGRAVLKRWLKAGRITKEEFDASKATGRGRGRLAS